MGRGFGGDSTDPPESPSALDAPWLLLAVDAVEQHPDDVAEAADEAFLRALVVLPLRDGLHDVAQAADQLLRFLERVGRLPPRWAWRDLRRELDVWDGTNLDGLEDL